MPQNDETQRQVAGAFGVSHSVISWLWIRLQVIIGVKERIEVEDHMPELEVRTTTSPYRPNGSF